MTLTWVEWVKLGIAFAVISGLYFGMCWAGDRPRNEDHE